MIERSDRDSIAVLRLAHRKVSALDVELCEALADALDGVAAAPPAAVVLTGSGSTFSAGVDLFRVLEGGSDYLERFLPALGRAFGTLFGLPVPVVAAVNGHAIAGGCVLVSCCDRRLMARGSGRIGVPELLVGVPFPALALEIMRFVLPAHHVQTVLYTGRSYTPEQALQVGLVDELADGDALLDRAVEEARALGSIAPATFRASKRGLRQPVLDRVAGHAEGYEREVHRAWRDPATHAVIRRYVERTIRRKG